MNHFDADTIDFCNHLLKSYRKFAEKELLAAPGDIPIQSLYNADFILVAHRVAKDPIFCFANLQAQKLWEMDWNEFTTTPSRLSAPENARAERQTLLDAASEKNIITDYTGTRISKSGQLFNIRDVTLWNIFDDKEHLIGQAATFSPDIIEYL